MTESQRDRGASCPISERSDCMPDGADLNNGFFRQIYSNASSNTLQIRQYSLRRFPCFEINLHGKNSAGLKALIVQSIFAAEGEGGLAPTKTDKVKSGEIAML